jgi:hypothetical protein
MSLAMRNNTKKRFPEGFEDILIFAVSMAGLVFMVFYWQ